LQRAQHALIGIDAGEQQRRDIEIAQDAVEHRVLKAGHPVFGDMNVARRDRPPCRRNVDADMGEPAVRVTKVVLHVDYDDRGAREIEGHDAVVGADSDRTRLRWNANEVGVSDADVPLIAGSGTERHQLWLFVH
jgi:hypothetical protein